MATLEEQQETIDTIKHGRKTYNIHVSGYGGEMVFGKATKEQYEFWSEYEDDERTMVDYMFDTERHSEEADYDWSDVPEKARFETSKDWYDHDDIEHTNGAVADDCYITIEATDDQGNSEEIFEGRLSELTENLRVQLGVHHYQDLDEDGNMDEDGHNYIFYGMSVEKGHFNNFEFEALSPPRWDLLRWDQHCYGNGDDMIDRFYFVNEHGSENENVEIWDQGGDSTTGKAFYAEVWDH